MDISDFWQATREVLRIGDINLLKRLERIAKSKDDPYYYSALGWMFEPIHSDIIQSEIQRCENIQFKMVAEVPSEILDNIENLHKIKDYVSSQYYFSLAFKGIQKLAENGDADAMSVLADMYWFGKGTPSDADKAKYWINQCYLHKVGVSYDEWLKKDG